MSTIKLDHVIRQMEIGLDVSAQDVRQAVGKNLDPGEETRLRGLLQQPSLPPALRAEIESILRPQAEGGLPRMQAPGSTVGRVFKGAVAGVAVGGAGGAAAGATFLGVGAVPGAVFGALAGGIAGVAIGASRVPQD